MQILNMKSPKTSSLSKPKSSPQHPDLQNPQPMPLPSCTYSNGYDITTLTRNRTRQGMYAET